MPLRKVYSVIDCSESMKGSRGDAVNMVMDKMAGEVVPKINASKFYDLKIAFKCYGFNDVRPCQVFTLMPDCTSDNFNEWHSIPPEMFSGDTPAGAALKVVAEEMADANFADSLKGAITPIIILVSDGLPNAGTPSYEEAIALADKNNPNCITEFRKAFRLAIG